MMRVRKGSAAEKYLRMCNWIDERKVMNCIITGLAIVGLFAYGLWSYPV